MSASSSRDAYLALPRVLLGPVVARALGDLGGFLGGGVLRLTLWLSRHACIQTTAKAGED